MGSIIYLGHASFLFKANDYQIVLDPYRDESVPNMTFPKGIEADAVFCSHHHFDHDATNLVKIKKDPVVIKGTRVVVPHDRDGGTKRGMNTIRMFEIDGYKVVHLGDTGCVPDSNELECLANCDVLLAPINGFFTINPQELKEIVDIIKPRIVIPMHYFMEEYQSGYPDNNIINEFKKEFPNYKELDSYEIDLHEYKDYRGVLILKRYLQ